MFEQTTKTFSVKEIMSLNEMAEYLGISADTLYRYASEGTIPSFKLGNRWRFRTSLVNVWADNGGTKQKEKA